MDFQDLGLNKTSPNTLFLEIPFEHNSHPNHGWIGQERDFLCARQNLTNRCRCGLFYIQKNVGSSIAARRKLAFINFDWVFLQGAEVTSRPIHRTNQKRFCEQLQGDWELHVGPFLVGGAFCAKQAHKAID